MKTNPNAIKTIQSNTIFTNVAETSDGGVYWEGIDQPLAPGIKLTSWKGTEWDPKDGKAPREARCPHLQACVLAAAQGVFSLAVVGEPCAHPNSRFCTPASQCPIIDPAWEAPEGVPIEGIIFGGRRPAGEAPLPSGWVLGVLLAEWGGECGPLSCDLSEGVRDPELPSPSHRGRSRPQRRTPSLAAQNPWLLGRCTRLDFSLAL